MILQLRFSALCLRVSATHYSGPIGLQTSVCAGMAGGPDQYLGVPSAALRLWVVSIRWFIFIQFFYIRSITGGASVVRGYSCRIASELDYEGEKFPCRWAVLVFFSAHRAFPLGTGSYRLLDWCFCLVLPRWWNGNGVWPQDRDYLEQEKFFLLTTSVTYITREQYVKFWRRWTRFCACMDTSPRLSPGAVGWGNTMIDFLVWGYKLLGITQIALANRFFAIRFAHIAEGHDDLSLRAHRARTALNAIKLRSKTCKKVPFNTDLLRWLRPHLEVGGAGGPSLHIMSVWTGMLLGFFFFLRISELLSLAPNDIKFREDSDGLILSVLIRSSKTDQEKGRYAPPPGHTVYSLPGGCNAQTG